MKFDKTLFSIIGACFIAEPFFIHLHNLTIFILSKILNVKCVFSYSGFGTMCRAGNDPALTLILVLSATIIVFVFALTGFILSKRGVINNSVLFTLTGALLFYSALHETLLFFLSNIRYNILGHIISPDDKFRNRSLEYFGNFYNYEIIFFTLNILFMLIYVFMAYQIIFKMWERDFRVKIFTVGLLSCLIGNIVWYFFLGKFIYSFWGGYIYS